MRDVTFTNSRGLSLAGSFYPAGDASAVILVHGFTSDRRSRGRFPRLAEALREDGHSSLAFDFSGCGESGDDTLTAAKQTDDLRAAVAYVKSLGFARIALTGNSLGGLICLRAASPDISSMVLTGAPTGPVSYDWDAYFSPEQMRELAGTGRLTVTLAEGPREKVIVEAEMLLDFSRIDAPLLLSRVQCPVLLIHGDGDEEERQLLALSRSALRYLPEGSRLEAIAGATHGLTAHYGRVIELTRAWLAP